MFWRQQGTFHTPTTFHRIHCRYLWYMSCYHQHTHVLQSRERACTDQKQPNYIHQIITKIYTVRTTGVDYHRFHLDSSSNAKQLVPIWNFSLSIPRHKKLHYNFPHCQISLWLTWYWCRELIIRILQKNTHTWMVQASKLKSSIVVCVVVWETKTP